MRPPIPAPTLEEQLALEQEKVKTLAKAVKTLTNVKPTKFDWPAAVSFLASMAILNQIKDPNYIQFGMIAAFGMGVYYTLLLLIKIRRWLVK